MYSRGSKIKSWENEKMRDKLSLIKPFTWRIGLSDFITTGRERLCNCRWKHDKNWKEFYTRLSLPSFLTSFIWHGKWFKASRDTGKRACGKGTDYTVYVFFSCRRNHRGSTPKHQEGGEVKLRVVVPGYQLTPSVLHFQSYRPFLSIGSLQWGIVCRPYQQTETISLCGDNCSKFFLISIFSVHPIFLVGQLRSGFSAFTICDQQSHLSVETGVWGRACVLALFRLSRAHVQTLRSYKT